MAIFALDLSRSEHMVVFPGSIAWRQTGRFASLVIGVAQALVYRHLDRCRASELIQEQFATPAGDGFAALERRVSCLMSEGACLRPWSSPILVSVAATDRSLACRMPGINWPAMPIQC